MKPTLATCHQTFYEEGSYQDSIFREVSARSLAAAQAAQHPKASRTAAPIQIASALTTPPRSVWQPGVVAKVNSPAASNVFQISGLNHTHRQ